MVSRITALAVLFVALTSLVYCEADPATAEVETPCTPGTTFKKDCNTCHCVVNSTAVCTIKDCVSNSTNGPATPCRPGTVFLKGCNPCYCTVDRIYVCPVTDCPPRPTRAVACTPGMMFKDRCNQCRCARDGKSAACTRKACPPGTY